LKKWQTEKPELFVKRVYKQAGLDTYTPVSLKTEAAAARSRLLG